MVTSVERQTGGGRRAKKGAANQSKAAEEQISKLYEIIHEMRQKLEQNDAKFEKIRANHEEIRANQEELKAEIRASYKELKAEIRANYEELKAEIRAENNRIRSDLANLKKFDATVVLRELIVKLRLKAVNYCFRKDSNQTKFESWEEFTRFARAQKRRKEMIDQVDSFITKRGINWSECLKHLDSFNRTLQDHRERQISEAMKSPYENESTKTLMGKVHQLLMNFKSRSPDSEEHKE